MHLPSSKAVKMGCLFALMICLGLTGCATGGERGSTALSRGAMVERVTASEVAARRTEARIQVDQYDLGLRNASASEPRQTPDEAVRQKASSAALSREIKELRRKLKGYRREQKTLHSRLGQ